MSNTTQKQKEYLENFLKTLKLDKNYCIVIDQIKGKTFALCTMEEGEPKNTISNFMKYESFNCYLFGVLVVKNNSIKF